MDTVENGISCGRMLRSAKDGVELALPFSVFLVDGGSRASLLQSRSLDGRLCKTEYAGLSLHVLTRESDGSVVHRRIGSDDPVERVPISRIITPPEFGHDKLYLAFGDQFYPLDYFGW